MIGAFDAVILELQSLAHLAIAAILIAENDIGDYALAS